MRPVFIGQVCDTRKNGNFERGVADEHVDVKKWQSKNGCKILKDEEGRFQGTGRWFGIALFLRKKL